MGAVCGQGLHISGIADDVLNPVAAASSLHVASECPLADTPVLYWARRFWAPITRHAAPAPIALTSHRAEVTPRGRAHIDADVV